MAEETCDATQAAPAMRNARALAFYLPQFHPIPENDEWWEPGFTEWTNTTRARPLFPRHYQPHRPSELGFYDLRDAASRRAQADLAAEHGLEGFVYWHYWFAGRRLLQQPLDAVLSSGQPEFGIALAWANQTWSGVWHGKPDEVLVEQTYPGIEDDRAHFEAVLPAFRDPRYIRVQGKPLFYVFRPEGLPNASAFVERWQQFAHESGLGGLYLVAEMSDLLGKGPIYPHPERDGFDAGLHVRIPARVNRWTTARMRVLRKLGLPEVYDYEDEPIGRPPQQLGRRVLPSVYPNWDNTPRCGRQGLVVAGSTPERFSVHVRDAVERLRPLPLDERLLFIKSWNEWAEGNHLEPDQRFGRGYLDVLARELRGSTAWDDAPAASA